MKKEGWGRTLLPQTPSCGLDPILPATKDEVGEQQHLIDGDLRRKKLRQRASHISTWHIWDDGEDSPTACGHLREAAACATADLPHPSSSAFSRTFGLVQPLRAV